MSSPRPAKRAKTTKKSTAIFEKLRQEGDRKPQTTGKYEDRDDRLPQQATALNLWADAYWESKCRTWNELIQLDASESQSLAKEPIFENFENPSLPPLPSTPQTNRQIYVHYYHHHIVSSSPHSKRSTDDIVASVQAIKMHNFPGATAQALAPVTEEEESSESSKTVYISTLNLHCQVSDIPAPPNLSYTTINIKALIADWNSSAALQIQGVIIPLKHWPEVYAKHRGELYNKKRELWRQWRTVVLAFNEVQDWDIFWSIYGQEEKAGSGRRKECCWTALKQNIKNSRKFRDEQDAAKARDQFPGREFEQHFSSTKSGRRTVMKSTQEIAHRYRVLTDQLNIWDQDF